MGLSARARQKGMRKVAALLPPGARPYTYAIGHAHARFSPVAAVIGVGFLGAFVVALALGVLLIPGGVLVVAAYFQVRPPRIVVVTDRGIAVVARSLWTGGPARLLAMRPLVPLRDASPSGSVTVDFGEERISFSRSEFEAVAAASSSLSPPAGGADGLPPASPPWPPPPSGPPWPTTGPA